MRAATLVVMMLCTSQIFGLAAEAGKSSKTKTTDGRYMTTSSALTTTGQQGEKVNGKAHVKQKESEARMSESQLELILSDIAWRLGEIEGRLETQDLN